MPRYRRKRSGRNLLTGVAAFAAVLAAGWYWQAAEPSAPSETDGGNPPVRLPVLRSDRPEVASVTEPTQGVSEKGALLDRTPLDETRSSEPERARELVAAGDQARAAGDAIAARAHYSEAMGLGLKGAERSRVRAELVRIAQDTIFSSRISPNDPLVDRYVIKPGDTLAKIAAAHKTSDDLLAAVNGIANKNLIRAGQSIKIIHGPFRAEVERTEYAMVVYLGNTYLTHFPVGLGADDSTPTGRWRVKNKLENPTYYPPRTGRIIAADDPTNPLGEHWIGLEGIEGEATGQERYGIHGTVEPDSIGRSSSLGCIRMYNEDVRALYTYLVTKHSTVTVR